LTSSDVAGGRVVEDNIQLQREEIPHPGEQPFLELLFVLGQEVQAAVELLKLERLELRPVDLLDPPRYPELTLRGHQAVEDHREDGFLDIA